MKVTMKMIDRQLRPTGVLMKAFAVLYGKPLFRAGNFFLDKTAAGKRLSKKIKYTQMFMGRKNGKPLRLCIYEPVNARPGKKLPAVLWIHGGGYALGVPEQDVGFASALIESADCIVFAPDYTRSVSEPYPAAVEDCYSTLLYLKDHAQSFGIDTDKIFVGGDSAGGGLAAALCIMARDRKEVNIAFQMPLYPMLDDKMQTASMQKNNAPVWNERASRIGWKLYLGDWYGKQNVPAYAAAARCEDVTGLPAALTYVGSVDPFRDETAEYVKKLKKADIPVSFCEFEGCYHGFDIVCPMSAKAKQARKFLKDGFRYAVEHYSAPQERQ